MKPLSFEFRNPFFIVSTGRSGSTMLAGVLAKHPAVCAFHEPHPHLRTEAFVKWSAPERAKAIERKIRKKREDLITQIMINRFIYVESSNYTSLLIEELYRLFDAKFIHLYRDGRDFVRSCLARDWYKHQSLVTRLQSLIRRRYLVDIGKTALDYQLVPPPGFKTRFEKIAWLWVEINESILRSLSSLPEERKFSLSLEELDRDNLIALHKFIRVEVYPEILEEMLEIASKRPNKTKVFTSPSYTGWSEWEKQRFTEIAGNTMRTLGYGL